MSARKGQTLIEVLVATMVAAMTATAVFSVVLSANVSGGRSDRKEAAGMVLSGVAEQLKVYVSAVPGDPTFSLNGGVWSRDTTPGNVWALRAGAHTVSSTYLNSIPELTGRNPTMTYTVTNSDCGFGTGSAGTAGDFVSCKRVDFSLQFTD